MLKKVHSVIEFNQELWLEPHIRLNTGKIKEAVKEKNKLKEIFLKLMNNVVFGKTMDNVKKHRDTKLVTTDKRRNQLVSEPNYHTKKWFSKNYQQLKSKRQK